MKVDVVRYVRYELADLRKMLRYEMDDGSVVPLPEGASVHIREDQVVMARIPERSYTSDLSPVGKHKWKARRINPKSGPQPHEYAIYDIIALKKALGTGGYREQNIVNIYRALVSDTAPATTADLIYTTGYLGTNAAFLSYIRALVVCGAAEEVPREEAEEILKAMRVASKVVPHHAMKYWRATDRFLKDVEGQG